MKVFSKIMIAAWLFATITSLHAFKVEKGFTSIFNGKDLTGWEGMPGMWMVKDGAITPKQSTINNWVFWRGGQPADFELRLSFRYHSGNSGVQVRTIEFEPFSHAGTRWKWPPKPRWACGIIPRHLRNTGANWPLPGRKQSMPRMEPRASRKWRIPTR